MRLFIIIMLLLQVYGYYNCLGWYGENVPSCKVATNQ